MSDSQKFPVAVHALLYLAHKGATGAQAAVSSAELAASMPTNPVVVRRVTAMLGRAGLIESRPGASGGAWLKLPASGIRLDAVLHAVGGCASLGCAPKGSGGCPVGAKIPEAVGRVLLGVSQAAADRLSRITLADLLAEITAASDAA
jgi:DNA-binding IscR family transcriptional regulator